MIGSDKSRVATHPDASSRIGADHAGQFEKTKPRSTPVLSPRQLAAARELARGKRVMTVSAELQIHRTTLLRWRSDPQFQAELQRLHRRLLRGKSSGNSMMAGAMTSPVRRVAIRRPTNAELNRKYDFDFPPGGVMEKILADNEEHRQLCRARRAAMRRM